MPPGQPKHTESIITKPFEFNWQQNGCRRVVVKADVPIPLDRDPLEYARMLGSSNSVPCFCQPDLENAFVKFVTTETDTHFSEEGDAAVSAFLDLPKTSAMSLAVEWEDGYKKSLKQFSPARGVSDREVFRNAYQSLLNSDPAAVAKILEKERHLANEMQSLVRRRDEGLKQIAQEPTEVLQNAVKNFGISYSNDDINQMTARHFEQIETTEAEYASKIAALAESQRREYEEFVVKLHERYVIQGGAHSIAFSAGSADVSKKDDLHSGSGDHNLHFAKKPVLEESFTINLGAQMKTMHNLRLAAVDPLDFCQHSLGILDSPQRLQMALGLYHNHLHGVVLLVNSRTRYHINFKTGFAAACEQSTELHFEDIAKQLSDLELDLERGSEWRYVQAIARQHSLASLENGSEGTETPELKTSLQVGDVYVTRHSNLSQVHTVFHLVEDDALKCKDINSRHPSINGLRNVVRVAVRFGVTHLSLPLLLVYHMNEEMTVSWCIKRAELIFKCVKGFLMESLTLNTMPPGHQFTVQFLVPPEMAPNLFNQLVEMLPQIFHMAGPVIAKVGMTKK